MPAALSDPVKQQVTAHWDKRAAGFDSDFGHSIATGGERAAWDRILDLVVPAGPLDALDIGCGTGFLSLELAARGHRVTGVDLAIQMLAEARRKAAAQGCTIDFKEADAESTGFAAGSFDLVISRHVLWTLPHPEAAIDEWLRVLRPGGRLVIIDGAQYFDDVAPPQQENARTSAEYADITNQLPFFGGRPRDDIETLLRTRCLTGIGADSLLGLIAAQAARAQAEGRDIRRRQRYVVWGNKPV